MVTADAESSEVAAMESLLSHVTEFRFDLGLPAWVKESDNPALARLGRTYALYVVETEDGRWGIRRGANPYFWSVRAQDWVLGPLALGSRSRALRVLPQVMMTETQRVARLAHEMR